MSEPFDREWTLAELLDQASAARLGQALSRTLAAPLAIVDAAGQVLWGEPSDALKQRVDLVIELEPVGALLAAVDDPVRLKAAGELLQAWLRVQVRYRMASSLHLEAVAADFESLKREHARLLESEARYRKLSEELDARVKTQVVQLEERQQMLYEAEKLASVGQLAAGMAHEINNPLGFVRSNLASFGSYLAAFAALRARLDEGPAAWQALDLDFMLEDGRELLRDSLQGLDRIARIVAELKSFSNVDRATEEYTDLNECIRHSAAMIETQLPAGIALHLDLQALPPVVCLPGHVNQVLFNILRNAIQAIQDSKHGGEIHIRSASTAQGIAIDVSDNGIGMPAEQLSRAFEPFYTTRPVGAGAGLGLSTARNIMLGHSGSITVDSQPGAGTTVHLFFPAKT